MKCFMLSFSFLFILFTAFAQHKSYFPQPIGFINDFESDLSADENKGLNNIVKDALRKDIENDYPIGLQIAIVSVTDSMFGDEKDMEAYATKLAQNWGVGAKDKNDGLVIAFSKKLKRVAIFAGADLQKLLTKETREKIIDEKILPQFRRNNYPAGITEALNSVIDYLGLSKR